MDKDKLTAALKAEARQLGFVLVGACPAVSPAGITRLYDWLQRGFDGEMKYLRNRLHAYADPGHVLAGARSLLVMAMPYRTVEPASPGTGEGRISRYAWSDTDYHDVMHQRMKSLSKTWHDLSPNAKIRGVVDTAPLLEREFAQLAGIGWIGKNTMLLNKFQGSWFFLAVLLTDDELEYDTPHETDHCGTCRLCLDACPTQAFPEPYVLDASRCISYLTIELRGQVPQDLRSGMQDWLFGCDICQDVCPWNRRAPIAEQPLFEPAEGMNPVQLGELFKLDDQAFRERFRHTPLWRPRRRGILRNAAIVLGNQRSTSGLEALKRGLLDDDAIVRGACAWAIGQIGGPAAEAALTDALTKESDPDVRSEIERSLQLC